MLLVVFSNSKIIIVLILPYPFPSLIWVIKLSLSWGTVWHVEIVKRYLPQNYLFWQNEHTIEFIDFLFCISTVVLHYIATWYSFMFFCIHCIWWIFWDSDEKITCRFEKTVFLRKLHWSHSLLFVYYYVIQLRYFWNNFLNNYKSLDSLLRKVWWCASSLISNSIISSECSYLPSYLLLVIFYSFVLLIQVLQ